MNQIRKISAVIVAFAWIFVLAHALTPHGHIRIVSDLPGIEAPVHAPWWIRVLESDLGTHHLEHFLSSDSDFNQQVRAWQMLAVVLVPLILLFSAFSFTPPFLANWPIETHIALSADASRSLVLRGPPMA